MSINVTPIPRLIELTTPAFTLGTSNAAGAALTAVASNSTILTYDTTLPDAITYGQSGATGSSSTAARRDHAHAMAATENDLVLIGTAVASDSATLTITGLDSTYDTYLIGASDIKIATDAQGLYFRMGDSSGIDSGASDYAYIVNQMSAASATGDWVVSTGNSQIVFASRGAGNATAERIGFVAWLVQPGDSAGNNLLTGTQAYMDHTGNVAGGSVVGMRNTPITLTQVQILAASGNLTSGRLSVWGYQHA